jgi:Tol biopolymer transport system component
MKQARTVLALSVPLLLVPAFWLSSPEGPSALVGALPDLGLQAPTPKNPVQESSIVIRRLWEGIEPDFWSADVSPDGRYVTETDWSTGDLAVLDLHEGALQRVTDKGSWSEAVEWAEASVFSPDGRQIAVNWWNQDDEGYEIRTIGLDGSGVRTVFPSPDRSFYSMVDSWSGDGQHILTRMWYGAGRDHVALVSVRDGSVRPLVEFENWDEPQLTALSPDGRFVAFDKPPGKQSDDHDIFVVSVDGGRESALVDGPGDDRLMGWAPDGSGILFHSDRELSEGFWWLPLAGATPAGDAYLVRSNVWRPEPIGFGADGRYFYGVTTQQAQVHTAGIDLNSNRLTTPPAAVEGPSAGRTRNGEWSGDGRFLAYVHETGVRRSSIVVRSTTGDGRQVIPFDGRIRQLMWLNDGNLVVDGAPLLGDGRWALYRIDLRTGERETLHRHEESENLRSVLSPDGRTLFRQPDPMGGSDNRIMARDLATGADRELARINGSGQIRPSPDGQFLMVEAWERESEVSRLIVVSVSDGAVQELYRVDAPDGLSVMDWTSDGAHVLFTTWDEGAIRELWRISVAGGEPMRITGIPPELPHRLRIHPDGNRVAFNSGELRGEVWVVEGLPGSAPTTDR